VILNFEFLKKRERIAVNGTPSHSYGTTLAIWDHSVLPATRHKWTHPALPQPVSRYIFLTQYLMCWSLPHNASMLDYW